MGDQPHQQWTQLLATALRDHPVVGVRAVVEWHLGRPPTRSESSAAHRAAHLMADDERVTLQQVRVRSDGRSRPYLLVGRDDLNLNAWPPRADLEAAALRYAAPAPQRRAALESMLNALYQAAGRADPTLLGALDPDAARAVADAMDAPLAQLSRVRRQLRRRIRR